MTQPWEPGGSARNIVKTIAIWLGKFVLAAVTVIVIVALGFLGICMFALSSGGS